MSTPDTPSKNGATFLWVLGAFAGFAVLFMLIEANTKQGETDPRAGLRLENKAEITKAQADLVSKMGLNDPAKRDALFTKAATELQAKKPKASGQVVPGSPTQLKQAAAPAAAPAPAAPAATPAPAAAPAPAAPASAAPAPTPAAPPVAPAPAPAAPAPPATPAPAPAAPVAPAPAN